MMPDFWAGQKNLEFLKREKKLSIVKCKTYIVTCQLNRIKIYAKIVRYFV